MNRIMREQKSSCLILCTRSNWKRPLKKTAEKALFDVMGHREWSSENSAVAVVAYYVDLVLCSRGNSTAAITSHLLIIKWKLIPTNSDNSLIHSFILSFILIHPSTSICPPICPPPHHDVRRRTCRRSPRCPSSSMFHHLSPAPLIHPRLVCWRPRSHDISSFPQLAFHCRAGRRQLRSFWTSRCRILLSLPERQWTVSPFVVLQ